MAVASLFYLFIFFNIHCEKDSWLNMFFYMQEYQSFRIGSDGNLQGVGLFINVEPNTGHLVGLTYSTKALSHHPLGS